MLKNIYVHISNPSINFCIRGFCRKFQDVLTRHHIFFVTFDKLFPEYPVISQPITWYTDLWPHEKTKRIYPELHFPREDEILERLSQTVESESVENLLLVLNGNDFDWYFPQLLLLKKLYPGAKFHCMENIVDLQRELESSFCLQKCFHTQNCAPLLLPYFFYGDYKNNAGLKQSYAEQIIKMRQKLQAECISSCFEHELDCFKYFLSWLNISFESPYFVSCTFHPQVLAFLIALQEYAFSVVVHDFYSEFDFLGYGQDGKTLFTYLSSKKTEQDSVWQDCSQSSLRINWEDAKALARLLSPEKRRFLLDRLDWAYFPYCPKTTKSAYLAVMLAENRISEEEAVALLPKTKGRINTGVQKYSKNPILTVYTMAYNQKDYIRQCVEGVLAQKVKYPFKHLIIDDASTDGTREILKEYAQKYDHIELILHKYNRSGAAIFHLHNVIDTAYAACCDGDDFYTDENKLQEQVAFLEEHKDYGLCFHETIVYYEEEKVVADVFPNEEILPKTNLPYFTVQQLIRPNIMQSSSVMYRWLLKDALPAHFPYPLSPLDWAMNILHAHKRKAGFIKKPMSLYRRHKKAIYFYTVEDSVRHFMKICMPTIKLFVQLDNVTQRQYYLLFLRNICDILEEFYLGTDLSGYDQKEYQKTKQRIESYIPDIVAEFKRTHQLEE